MEENGGLVGRAAKFAEKAHEGQFRKAPNGGVRVPYIVHPELVVALLRRYGELDEVLLAAAYLHDVTEDCAVPNETLVVEFGPEVAALVAEVTDKPGPSHVRKAAQEAHAPHYTPRAKLLKLADKTANVIDIVRYDPGWDKARIEGYVNHCRRVVNGMGPMNEGLRGEFEAACLAALNRY